MYVECLDDGRLVRKLTKSYWDVFFCIKNIANVSATCTAWSGNLVCNVWFILNQAKSVFFSISLICLIAHNHSDTLTGIWSQRKIRDIGGTPPMWTWLLHGRSMQCVCDYMACAHTWCWCNDHVTLMVTGSFKLDRFKHYCFFSDDKQWRIQDFPEGGGIGGRQLPKWVC